MNQNDVIGLFEACGALQTGHFQYASGRHGSAYVNKDAVIAHPEILAPLCQEIAGHFASEFIEVVAAPATGGIALTQWVAHFLAQKNRPPVLAVYAEKENDGLVFKRKYGPLLSGKRVLLLEDIVTTGGSLEKLITAVGANAGEIVGAGLLWNRGGVEFSIPTFSLVNKTYPSWAPEECELCAQGIPLDSELGHGAKKGA